jgi:hypothetical protein
MMQALLFSHGMPPATILHILPCTTGDKAPDCAPFSTGSILVYTRSSVSNEIEFASHGIAMQRRANMGTGRRLN